MIHENCSPVTDSTVNSISIGNGEVSGKSSFSIEYVCNKTNVTEVNENLKLNKRINESFDVNEISKHQTFVAYSIEPITI